MLRLSVRRSAPPLLAVIAAALAGLGASFAAQPAERVPLATLAHVAGPVELAGPGQPWVPVQTGATLAPGERIRTGPLATVQLDFRWVRGSLGAEAQLSIPDSAVLALHLDRGRIELATLEGEIIKLVTAEARVRGEGRVVVRRTAATTLVSVLSGIFRVEGAGEWLTVSEGHGAIVPENAVPQGPIPLPVPPTDLTPGEDPVYGRPERPFRLTWVSKAQRHHVQVLPMHSEDIVLTRDVEGLSAQVVLPWPGMYRWRVTVRDDSGLESLTSREGLIVVVSYHDPEAGPTSSPAEPSPTPRPSPSPSPTSLLSPRMRGEG